MLNWPVMFCMQNNRTRPSSHAVTLNSSSPTANSQLSQPSMISVLTHSYKLWKFRVSISIPPAYPISKFMLQPIRIYSPKMGRQTMKINCKQIQPLMGYRKKLNVQCGPVSPNFWGQRIAIVDILIHSDSMSNWNSISNFACQLLPSRRRRRAIDATTKHRI